MNLKTIRSCLLAATFLIALQALPKGSIVNLKGMTSKLTCLDHDEHKTSEQLSPTMGALFWESPFIINIHMFGPDDAMKRLINELFFVQTDGSLSATCSYTKIARYFTPELIGQLVGTIYKRTHAIDQEEHGSTFGGDEKHRAQKLFDTLITPQLMTRLNEDISEKIITPYAQHNISGIKKTILDGLNNTKQRYQTTLTIAQAHIAQAQSEQSYIKSKAALLEAANIAKGYIEKLRQCIGEQNLCKITFIAID